MWKNKTHIQYSLVVIGYFVFNINLTESLKNNVNILKKKTVYGNYGISIIRGSNRCHKDNQPNEIVRLLFIILCQL